MLRNKRKKLYSFESKNYKMKKEYLLKKLVIAKLERVSSFGDEEDYTPKIERTNQKYIFEILTQKNGKMKYREIFTGFIASDKTMYFDVPYLTDIVSITDYYPELSENKISYLDFLWILNDINYENNDKKYIKK